MDNDACKEWKTFILMSGCECGKSKRSVEEIDLLQRRTDSGITAAGIIVRSEDIDEPIQSIAYHLVIWVCVAVFVTLSCLLARW